MDQKTAIDIWCRCFFGYVDKDSRRMCAYADTPFACKDGCPYFLTKRQANEICKSWLREEILK